MLWKSIDLRNKVNDSFGDVKKADNRKVEAFAGEGKSGIDYLKDTLKVWRNHKPRLFIRK